MKKETTKKSKLWLWILLAVLGLAIIGGAVAAFVLPGLMQPQGPTGPVAEAKIYFNVDKSIWLEAETNMSAREKAEDGYYAEYNFGKYILHNRTTGKCWPIGDTVAVLLDTQEK